MIISDLEDMLAGGAPPEAVVNSMVNSMYYNNRDCLYQYKGAADRYKEDYPRFNQLIQNVEY